MTEITRDDLDMENEDTLRDKYLTFQIEHEEYGIEIRHVTEIIGIQRYTPVPNTPPYIRGVINLRGKVIPIMDVRLRFQMSLRDYDERTCVVVVRIQDTLVGLVVDTVSEVVSIASNDIQSAPTRNDPSHQFVQGLGKIGDNIKILLDVPKLLHEGELEQLAEMAS